MIRATAIAALLVLTAATGLPLAFKDGPAKQQVKLPKAYREAVKHDYGIK